MTRSRASPAIRETGRHARGGAIVEDIGGAGAPASTAKDPTMTLFDGITARVVETPG